MDYKECEAAKIEAWSVLRDGGASTYKKAWYALYKLIDAHYWRAKDHVEGCAAPFRRKVFGRSYSPQHELDIDVYTRHWLWANAERLLPPDVVAEIADIWGYTPQEHKLLPKGASTYGERGISTTTPPKPQPLGTAPPATPPSHPT